MKGDLSRDTFNPAARYSAVRMQQGRVITDADFNEQSDITRYRTQRLVEDTIGHCGAPAENPGYALAAGTRALAVHAADANAIWIAGEDGVLLRSTNGGAASIMVTEGGASSSSASISSTSRVTGGTCVAGRDARITVASTACSASVAHGAWSSADPMSVSGESARTA